MNIFVARVIFRSGRTELVEIRDSVAALSEEDVELALLTVATAFPEAVKVELVPPPVFKLREGMRPVLAGWFEGMRAEAVGKGEPAEKVAALTELATTARAGQVTWSAWRRYLEAQAAAGDQRAAEMLPQLPSLASAEVVPA